MTDEELNKTLYNACKERIEDFEMKEALSLKQIGMSRCPLSYCSYGLYNEMEKAITEYCEDNGIGDIFINVEDVFWEGGAQ